MGLPAANSGQVSIACFLAVTFVSFSFPQREGGATLKILPSPGGAPWLQCSGPIYHSPAYRTVGRAC